MKIENKIIGYASIVQALLYLILVISIAFLPIKMIIGDIADFAAAYQKNAAPFWIMSLSFIVLGILGFFVAPATTKLFSKDNMLIRIGKYIALISLFATTAYFIWLVVVTPANVDALVSDPARVVHNPHAPLNWISYFTFGGMGLWVLFVAISALVSKALPKNFAFISFVKTFGFWLILAGALLGNILTAEIGAVIGGLIGGPIYHFWLGKILIARSGNGN